MQEHMHMLYETPSGAAKKQKTKIKEAPEKKRVVKAQEKKNEKEPMCDYVVSSDFSKNRRISK
jgi:hypothetical protein